MALLPYLDESKASAKTLETLRGRGYILNVSRMIANASEGVFEAFSGMGRALMTQSKIPPKLRELTILRNAKVCNSLYEFTQHVPPAKSVGVTEEQIKALDNWEKATCFNEVERTVLRFVDEVAGHVKGRKETLEALKKHLGTTEIVELLLAIGFWGMVARLLETTEVDLDNQGGAINILDYQKK
jgi:4-carboxymuconolactone decarboxylase